MIDLKKAQELIADPAKDRVTVSRGFIEQMVAELAAGREVYARLGHVFGLKPEQSL